MLALGSANQMKELTEGMELLGDIKEECIDNYTKKFIEIFHKTLNIHAPLRKQSRKETKLKNKIMFIQRNPYINPAKKFIVQKIP